MCFPVLRSKKAKPVHMRQRVNCHGNIVAVCSTDGLSIKRERASWTAIESLVTCEQCREKIAVRRERATMAALRPPTLAQRAGLRELVRRIAESA